MVKVLVVDDSPELRFMTLRILHEAGFFCVAAENGSSALEELKHESFDAIVLDIDMPVMDGLEFLKVRAGDTSLSKIPVIVFSAHEPIRELEGVTEWVSKPCVEQDILSAIRRAVSR